MPDKEPIPYKGAYRPEFERDQHRPVGSPRPRENKSQQAQLMSAHDHGTRKDIKNTRDTKPSTS